MVKVIEGLVKTGDEIVTEEITTVKMIVPMSFELKDGVCVNADEQELYDFLSKRNDVIQEENTEDNTVENSYEYNQN